VRTGSCRSRRRTSKSDRRAAKTTRDAERALARWRRDVHAGATAREAPPTRDDNPLGLSTRQRVKMGRYRWSRGGTGVYLRHPLSNPESSDCRPTLPGSPETLSSTHSRDAVPFGSASVRKSGQAWISRSSRQPRRACARGSSSGVLTKCATLCPRWQTPVEQAIGDQHISASPVLRARIIRQP